MANDPVADALAGAKDTLAKANKFTQSVVGNSTNAFAPHAMPAHIGGIPATHEHAAAPYGLARELRAKQVNVDEYKAAQ